MRSSGGRRFFLFLRGLCPLYLNLRGRPPHCILFPIPAFSTRHPSAPQPSPPQQRKRDTSAGFAHGILRSRHRQCEARARFGGTKASQEEIMAPSPINSTPFDVRNSRGTRSMPRRRHTGMHIYRQNLGPDSARNAMLESCSTFRRGVAVRELEPAGAARAGRGGNTFGGVFLSRRRCRAHVVTAGLSRLMSCRQTLSRLVMTRETQKFAKILAHRRPQQTG